MRNILTIALNQIRIQLSERGYLIQAIVVPVIMMVFIGGFTSNAGWQTRVIDVVRGDQDDALVEQFLAYLQADGAEEAQPGRARFVVCDLRNAAALAPECNAQSIAEGADLVAVARERVDNNQVTAAITLPDQFGEAILAGQQPDIEIRTRFGDIQASQTVQGWVQAVITRLGGAISAAKVATEVTEGDSVFYDRVLDAARSAWDADPVEVEQTYSTVTGTDFGVGVGQSAPGIGTMFVMISAFGLLQVFVSARQNWTMQRLMIMPLSRGQILAGMLLGQYMLSLINFAAFIGAGVVLGVQWGDPIGVVVVAMVYTLSVTALALAFSAIVRTAGQAAGFGLLIPMVMAPLGGAWWSASISPQVMQTLGRVISPIAWAMTSFNEMVFYGRTLVDVLPYVGIMLVFTAVFFVFGLVRFRYE